METTTEPFNKENQAGPDEFYFENGKLPKFLMMVEEGIKVTLFENDEVVDTFSLNKPAKGGISGSKVNDPDAEEIQIDIDYKGQEIDGEKKINGEDLNSVIKGLQLEMSFEMKAGGMWSLGALEVHNLGYKGQFINEILPPRTVHGYEVSAPRGLSWGCHEPGMFRQHNTSDQYSIGLQFPNLQLQVFEVELGKFGPTWECGELLSVGLITGVLVSLGFSIICFWGFSMLANINTMDRFDDPKGPSIYVPNTD